MSIGCMCFCVYDTKKESERWGERENSEKIAMITSIFFWWVDEMRNFRNQISLPIITSEQVKNPLYIQLSHFCIGWLLLFSLFLISIFILFFLYNPFIRLAGIMFSAHLCQYVIFEDANPNKKKSCDVVDSDNLIVNFYNPKLVQS